MIVCLAANPSVDKLFQIQRLVRGDIHRPDGFVQVPGGKGLNAARAAHASARGSRSRCSEGTPASGSRRCSVPRACPCAPVWTHGENRSSLSVADRETGGLTEFYEHGADVPLAAWAELLHAVESTWTPEGGSRSAARPPSARPDSGYRDLVRDARVEGVRVALDAEGERLRLALEAHPDVVKVNSAEAGGLLGVPTTRRNDALAAAEKLRDMAGGDGHAGLVTRGAEGRRARHARRLLYEGRLYVAGRYPVGSGDAFLAGRDHRPRSRRRLGGALRLGAGRRDRERRDARCVSARPRPRRRARRAGRGAAGLTHTDRRRRPRPSGPIAGGPT